MQDKGFQPACLFQWLDLLADMTDEIEIEVLQHETSAKLIVQNLLISSYFCTFIV
jgi:hypothetical protein